MGGRNRAVCSPQKSVRRAGEAVREEGRSLEGFLEVRWSSVEPEKWHGPQRSQAELERPEPSNTTLAGGVEGFPGIVCG